MKKLIIIILFILLLSGCTQTVVENNTSTPTMTVLPTPLVTPSATPTVTPPPTPVPTDTPIPQDLLGYKIGIDPGHQRSGNSDEESQSPYYVKMKAKCSFGTHGVLSQLKEHVFNLDISFLLKAALEERGASVFMTREVAEVDISNQERAKMVKEAGCDVWIRIHANSSKSPSKTGISMLTPKYKSVSTHLYEESKRLSGLIQKNVITFTDAKDHKLSYRGDITGFNWSRIPVTLIECGYMSNEEDDKLLNDDAYRALLVSGMVDGFIQYFAGIEMPAEYDKVIEE
ncbi:MAG: N-acetylmuramoyl-L-alanine amidase [Clostridiales bacterium]|nr:N-acetylmuramoyl-L-alanine amidase [Clostridiales bacterium]